MSMTAEPLDDCVPPGGGHLSSGHLSVVRSRDDEVMSRLGELAGHIHAATAELVMLLGELETCGGWQGVGLRSIGHSASIELGIDARTACAQARAGQRLATVPAVAAAALRGELGWAKVRLLAGVVEPESQGHWLGLAREMSVGQLHRVVAAYRRVTDDDTPGPVADDARRRRGIWLFDEPDGLVRVTALLEPDDAAVLRAALAAHLELLWRTSDDSDPGDTEPSDTEPSDTDRTAGISSRHVQPATGSEADPTLAAADPLATRRVDALVSLLRTALAQPGVPDLADDSTQVMLHIDHDLLTGQTGVGRSHLAHGPSVPVTTARRLCCDATLRPLVHRSDGQPLDVGRSTRTVNRAQRRALRFRDGGCTFPGCQARLWLDAHHIVHWADGGATDLENLTLLCRHHHRLHHEGGYKIAMVGGRPCFYRPDGTQIRPPDPPPPDPDRGAPMLRWEHVAAGTHIDRHTPAARSGGAPLWSPQHALDALLN